MGATHDSNSSDDSAGGKRRVVLAVVAGILFAAVWIGFLAILIRSVRDPPYYSAAIAAASGLEPSTTTTAAAALMNPVFNVTVRVTSRSRDEACLDPDTSVQVSYLRVPLAGGHARLADGGGGGRLCAPPWKHADHDVVARGKAVAVPGYLLDSLAEDVRTGEAVFQVTLMSPAYAYGGYWHVYTCWGKVGDAAALDHSCEDSWVRADVLPVPQPGGHGDLTSFISSGGQT
jgi:hypothetical protein